MTAETAIPALRVEGLSKTFGDKTVLRGVDLTVRRAETVVIIGASGSGKTTLLRCVNYLERPTAGTIDIDGEADRPHRRSGRVWKDASERALAHQRSRIGFVFQRFNLFPHLSALDNVAIGLRKVRGLAKGAARERAAEHLRKVFLGDHLDKRPAELSGGQQQRVAIARAIAMEPIDHPVRRADLGARSRARARSARCDPHAGGRTGMTSVIVTHEMSFALQVANRVIYMDEGAIVEQGPPADLFGAPREARTRRFLEHFAIPQARPAP